MATFGPLLGRQPQSPDINHCVLYIRPEIDREPRSEVGSVSLAQRLVGFEPGTFRFWLQRLNPLGHSPQMFPCFLEKMSPNYLEKEKFQVIMRKEKLLQNLYLKLRNNTANFFIKQLT